MPDRSFKYGERTGASFVTGKTDELCNRNDFDLTTIKMWTGMGQLNAWSTKLSDSTRSYNRSVACVDRPGKIQT